MKKVIAAAAVAAILATGCSEYNNKRGIGDAPVDRKNINDNPAHIINMPDTFSNVAFKCDGKNGIYVTTKDAPPVVVPSDPNCQEQ